ncbi:MAG: hypothetical protein LUF26_07725, partial [Firmicutes bacterium]|nr:hypothetical protein [Bacillota bacterium]
GFIGGMLLLIVLIPIASVILTIPIEFIALLFSTFGVEGTFGLSIIAAIILGILSNCVFIFFF